MFMVKGSSLFLVMTPQERRMVKTALKWFNLDQNSASDVKAVYEWMREWSDLYECR